MENKNGSIETANTEAERRKLSKKRVVGNEAEVDDTDPMGSQPQSSKILVSSYEPIDKFLTPAKFDSAIETIDRIERILSKMENNNDDRETVKIKRRKIDETPGCSGIAEEHHPVVVGVQPQSSTALVASDEPIDYSRALEDDDDNEAATDYITHIVADIVFAELFYKKLCANEINIQGRPILEVIYHMDLNDIGIKERMLIKLTRDYKGELDAYKMFMTLATKYPPPFEAGWKDEFMAGLLNNRDDELAEQCDAILADDLDDGLLTFYDTRRSQGLTHESAFCQLYSFLENPKLLGWDIEGSISTAEDYFKTSTSRRVPTAIVELPFNLLINVPWTSTVLLGGDEARRRSLAFDLYWSTLLAHHNRMAIIINMNHFDRNEYMSLFDVINFIHGGLWQDRNETAHQLSFILSSQTWTFILTGYELANFELSFEHVTPKLTMNTRAPVPVLFSNVFARSIQQTNYRVFLVSERFKAQKLYGFPVETVFDIS